MVCDNYATHKHPAVKAWLAKNPRVTMHFTPTSGSWLNLVEIFFGIITRQAIRRGTHRSVTELIDAIERVHRRLERTLPTLRLDQDRRRNHHQGRPSNHFKLATLVATRPAFGCERYQGIRSQVT